MSRKMVFLMALVVWAGVDLLIGDSLRPIISQAVFGGSVLLTHWGLNK